MVSSSKISTPNKMTHFRTIMNFRKKVSAWTSSHYINLAIFNSLTVILVLLHSAKYFDPFWVISINTVIFILLVVSVLLLGTGSRTLFLIAASFLIFAGFMKMLGIGVWAERVAIYMFQAFLLGVLLLFIEDIVIYTHSRKHGKI